MNQIEPNKKGWVTVLTCRGSKERSETPPFQLKGVEAKIIWSVARSKDEKLIREKWQMEREIASLQTEIDQKMMEIDRKNNKKENIEVTKERLQSELKNRNEELRQINKDRERSRLDRRPTKHHDWRINQELNVNSKLSEEMRQLNMELTQLSKEQSRLQAETRQLSTKQRPLKTRLSALEREIEREGKGSTSLSAVLKDNNSGITVKELLNTRQISGNFLLRGVKAGTYYLDISTRDDCSWNIELLEKNVDE